MKFVLSWLLRFWLRPVIVGKYLIFKGEVCEIFSINQETGVWRGEWRTGSHKGKSFRMAIDRTWKKEWKRLLYTNGSDKHEIEFPYCRDCGEFLGTSYYHGIYKSPPRGGLFCPKCF